MPTDLWIRPYQKQDRPAIREICNLTGFMGEPSGWYWRDTESFADIWTGYYTDREPESTFVAVRDGKVVGYLLGCVDSRLAPTDEANFVRLLFKRFLFLRPGTAGFFWRCGLDLLRDRSIPTRGAPLDQYPSHLHIDLLPEGRGCGAGSALMHAWFERLQSAGSPGCHLGTLAENTRGIAFFERMGFQRFGAPVLVPGMRTRRGERMHDQIMVRQIPGA